jgi:hypothetical protein
MSFESLASPDGPEAEFHETTHPCLGAFVEKHRKSYDPKTDRYDVPAFSRDILVDKAAAPKVIYDLHMYWSKKHWKAICEYIEHYLPLSSHPKGTGLILEPFSGSGSTGVAAVFEGRPCLLIDASPAAAFISHNYVHPPDPAFLAQEYEQFLTRPYSEELRRQLRAIAGREIHSLDDELQWLYETKCDRCGGTATTEIVVSSQTFQCPSCGEIIALFDCPVVDVEYQRSGRQRSGQNVSEKKRKNVCPHCYRKHHQTGQPGFVISTRAQRYGEIPVKVVYTCENGCKPKRDTRLRTDASVKKRKFFEQFDLAKLEALSNLVIPHPYPDRKMMDVEDPSKPWGMKWRSGTGNFQTVKELYTHRNFWALSAIAEALPKNRLGSFLVNMAGMNVSRMRRNREKGGGVASGTYYIPQINREDHPLDLIHKKFRALIEAATLIRRNKALALVVRQSARKVDLPPDSIDYIFTDPPYANYEVQYGELNFIWEAWLEFHEDWRDEELTIKMPKFDPKGVFTFDAWDERLRSTFRMMFRVLKPGRWVSLCYHDISEGTWRRVQDALLDVGFEIHTVTVLDPLQKSSKQLTAEKIVKSDLVLNCRKPKAGELALTGAPQDNTPVQDRVRVILEETIAVNPGQTRDKLFDLVTRRLLERAQFVEHRFGDILRSIAAPAEGDRWYLKQELEQLSQSDLENEERAGDALVRFARLRCAGVPAKYAAVVALEHPDLCRTGTSGRVDEDAVEAWINLHLFKEDRELLTKKNKRKLELGGRLAGIEFYDALFFYFTKYMKGKKGHQLPRRNLAEFLQEYLFRFRDGERWLYKPPEGKQEEELRAARRKGLGRHIRAFANGLREGERTYIEKHRPDPRTFVEWLRYCATYGHYEDGLLLYEKAGFTVAQLQSIVLDEAEEETAYDTARQYADTCRRRLAVTRTDAPALDFEEAEEEEEDEE